MKQHHNQGFASVPRWAWLWAALALATLALIADADANEISGKVQVVDGDTIDVGGTRVRLCGIDAPESATGAGKRATAWAKAEWSNASVTCRQRHTDRYDRAVAVCTRFIVGFGNSDLAKEALAAGHAVQWARYWRACGYHSKVPPNARP